MNKYEKFDKYFQYSYYNELNEKTGVFSKDAPKDILADAQEIFDIIEFE